MSRVSARTGILPSLAAVEKSIQPEPRSNCSYWNIVNVHKILPPAGVIALVDSCCLSVSTTAGLCQTKPWSTKPQPAKRAKLKVYKTVTTVPFDIARCTEYSLTENYILMIVPTLTARVQGAVGIVARKVVGKVQLPHQHGEDSVEAEDRVRETRIFLQ